MLLVRLFLRVGISIVVVLVALIWASTTSGRALRMDDMNWRTLQRLDYCELPCWAGITPLETDFNQVEELLKTAFPDMNIHAYSDNRDSYARFHARDDDALTEIIVTSNNGLVQRMGLFLRIPLWFLFEQFGTPDLVTSSDATSTGTVIYEGPNITLHWIEGDLMMEAVMLVGPETHLRPNMSSLYLQFLPVDYSDRRSSGESTWRGFMLARAYGVRHTF